MVKLKSVLIVAGTYFSSDSIRAYWCIAVHLKHTNRENYSILMRRNAFIWLLKELISTETTHSGRYSIYTELNTLSLHATAFCYTNEETTADRLCVNAEGIHIWFTKYFEITETISYVTTAMESWERSTAAPTVTLNYWLNSIWLEFIKRYERGFYKSNGSRGGLIFCKSSSLAEVLSLWSYFVSTLHRLDVIK